MKSAKSDVPEPRLVSLALSQPQFGSVTESDLKFLRCAANGTIAYFGPSERDDDPSNDPANAENWTASREVSSALIKWLCTGPDPKPLVHPRGNSDSCGPHIRSIGSGVR